MALPALQYRHLCHTTVGAGMLIHCCHHDSDSNSLMLMPLLELNADAVASIIMHMVLLVLLCRYRHFIPDIGTGHKTTLLPML